MKKMKKLLATLVCFVMVIATLSACTANTGNTDNKPSEATPKPTEEVTQPTTEVTQTPDVTEEPTVTTDPQQTEGDIIPLFPAASNDQVHQLTAEELQQASNFITLFNAVDTGKVYGTSSDDNRAAPLYTTEFMNRSFEIGYQQPNGSTVSVTFYFPGPIPGVGSEDSYVYDTIYYEIEGGESGTLVLIMPLYYNQSRQCLVAYRKKAGVYSLCEIYFHGTAFSSQIVEDTSIYGF